jgi:signal transduction histidine kinase
MALPRAQQQLVEQISRVIQTRGVAATWAKQLLDSFVQEITTESQGRFRSTLDGMLQQGVLDGDETAAWQSAISVLRREMLPALEIQRWLQAENLFGQARVVIGEAIQRAQSARQLQEERQSQALRDIGQALITAYDIDALGEILAERLPELGIGTCYMALYENPSESIEWSKLMLAYIDGQRTGLSRAGYRFPSSQLVPPSLLPARRYSLLVEPLYFQTEPIGFVVFEVGPRDGAVYEVLRGHISSALKGALLFRDAHEARRAAERADQIKTRLLANVSHELRTPLNIIIGHTQRILASPPPNLVKDLEHIQHSAEHQLRIINDLLDLSRAEINALDLYPVPLDPRTLIEEAFSALSENVSKSGEVTWRLDMPDALPVVLADPVRLRQVLLNLLSNAAKFTKQGQITLGADLAPPHLHIWVADTGAGIPSEMQERIYEPFFTHERTDQQVHGIGLGLSITRHLVALHHGYLQLDSEPGQGSTFHIYLPVPSMTDHVPATQAAESTLWLISGAQAVPSEILSSARVETL